MSCVDSCFHMFVNKKEPLGGDENDASYPICTPDVPTVDKEEPRRGDRISDSYLKEVKQ